MEEILKQILTEMQELKANQAKTDQKLDSLGDRVDSLGGRVDLLGSRVDSLGDRIDAHDRSNREEFRKLDKKLDGITEVVAKTMEDITDIKVKLEKQDIELKVLKGGK